MKIAVLLSGGVDSSVALNLIKERGCYEITAFYLKIWLEDDLAFLGTCPWETDLHYARAVCKQAGVPLKIVSLQAEYFAQVVGHTLNELRAGRTPSPDILCNQRIKFGVFLNKIDAGYGKVASGHYAQLELLNGDYILKRSPDPVKDQTYFLSHLNQRQLARALFPVGHLTKREVRTLAQHYNLPNKDRKDSQGICFLGKIKYPNFVRFHLGERSGDILEIESGRVLGQHHGFWFYTIGQRQGLRLSGGPWYVVKKDPVKNHVYVSHKEAKQRYARNKFTVDNINWIGRQPDKRSLQVKIRHGPRLYSCQVEPVRENRVAVTMAAKDPGIAAGQYAVFYDGDICLGGGIIDVE